MKKTPTPPKWAKAFLAAYCRPELLEDLDGDLNEYFHRNVQAKGAFLARLIYIIDVFKFFRPYTLRKPTNPFNQRILFTSYLRTSTRSVFRSKLFSGINIVGMAVSLSVGLLVITFVSDLLSYDGSLQNKDRIYRVTSSFTMAGMPPAKLATTSWKTGILIKQQVPNVESMVILRNRFSGDAAIGDSKIPVTGLYADDGFFNVFSFPLLKGVASTALKNPHTLVLTQTTATKLFGHADPIGKVLKFDTVNYTVTGLMADLPRLSHIHFEMLVSLTSIDLNTPDSDGELMDWRNFFSNYVYVLLKPHSDPAAFKAALDRIAARENAPLSPDHRIFPDLQPLEKIHIGHQMGNEISPVVDPIEVYVLCGLALVIILSACFNYTNLSIARSLRRSREVGIRKVMGARRSQVIGQFIAESVLISLLSLVVAFGIFLVIRGEFLTLHPQMEERVTLELSPRLIVSFIGFAIMVGIVAGLLPALFYSKISAVQVLKDAASVRVFRHISLRKALVVVQYTFSLAFITATIISYKQYKGFVRFDLGFTTTNVLNIKMQGNDEGVFVKQLAALPAVKGISKSLLVSSLGSIYGIQTKYNNPADSADVNINFIDENYLPLHKYTFLAGRNFTPKAKGAPETETIVNEQILHRFNIGNGNPAKALGQTLNFRGTKLTIVGVLKDFHYGTLDKKIEPTALRYSASPGGYLNVKLATAGLPATMTSVESLWKQLDRVHPLDAKFYDEQIERSYSFFSALVKIIGFFAVLAICISSLGLFGMVVYTMEKRVKEISIRRVLGARNSQLIYLLSKGFLTLLLLSAMIALPLTGLFFQKIVLARFAYHQPIRFGEMFIGLFIVGGIALVMIGLQTGKVIRANPARVLKNE